MQKTALFSVILAFFSVSCSESDKDSSHLPANVDQAQHIIDLAIDKAGGDRYNNSEVRFEFRDVEYISKRRNGQYEYQRVFRDELGNETRDVLNNEKFERTTNGGIVQLPDSLAHVYSNSLNSVHYFAQLPFGLNDPAVNKNYLDTVTLFGSSYHKIKITFDEEGGGEDFQDEFLYWINSENYTIDYLAYSFHTNGGGMRFRQAMNPREAGGIRFADYRNYAPVDPSVKFESLDQLFIEGQLKLVSEIALTNIEVKTLD